MKREYQNEKFKDVTTEDLRDRIDFLDSQLLVIQNSYDYMYKEWCNEIAYRLYAN